MFLIDFLRAILDTIFDITGSYGWSIIVLSLVVTLLMLPLFWIAEMIQSRERRRKLKMLPALEQLKDVSNKQEKYFYTKTIYRQHQYAPLYALSGLLGLVIQIPFFIAAYWMLIKYTPIEGVSFGPIKDLSQADGLILLSNEWSINLLPFVMTSVNLISGYWFAKEKDKNEQLQLIVIALVFLVLLYDLSSALVLFWTMNSVFSIVKNGFIKNTVNDELVEKILASKVIKWSSSQIKILLPFWYVLLFSIFPILSFYYNNIEQVLFNQLIPFLLIILLLTLISSSIARLIFQNTQKAILLGFIGVALFFSYEYVFHFIIEMNLDQMESPMLFMLIPYIYVGTFLLSFFFLLKSKVKRISNVIQVFSVCLFLIVVVKIISYNLNHSINYVAERDHNGDTELNYEKNAKYPDIYFIVLDGYANAQILQEVHDFNNIDFENFLKKKGFYVASESRSNYVQTFLSLPATLNMEYINYLSKKLGKKSKDTKLANEIFWNNKVMKYLKNKGYKTVHFKSGWMATDYNANADFNLGQKDYFDDFSITFLQTTLLNPFIGKILKTGYRENILNTFDKLANIDDIKEPKFVFAHIVSPHPPYAFDEYGNANDFSKLDNDWSNDSKKEYIGQLKFTNYKTKILIEQLLKKKKETEIILQSEHGSAFMGHDKDWNHPENALIRERSLILNAIFLNNENIKGLYAEISSVNTFRVVFNNIFNEKFQILNDSTYFSSYESPYNFINVTDKLLE